MPKLKTRIFGINIDLEYQANEETKLLKLINDFNNRFKNYSYLSGKVSEVKLLILASLALEDELNENISKLKHKDIKMIDLTNKIKNNEKILKENFFLKDKLKLLENKNNKINEESEKIIIELDKIENKILDINNRITKSGISED